MTVVAGENPDVAVALAGGSTYDSRLAELRRSTDIYNQAVADLRLGKEAKAAWAEASAAREEARALLDAAKADAASIVEGAKAEAKDVRDKARALAKSSAQSNSDASAARTQADELLAQAGAKAGAARQEADAIIAAATARAAQIGADVEARSAALTKREQVADDKIEKAKTFLASVRALVKDLK